MASDKGGSPGQWSARKAQMLVQEYERRGGGYRQDENREEAESLREWTDQEWQTNEGSAFARLEGEKKRYLPKRAWDLLDEEEKKEADRRKQQGTEAGKQFVANTIEAKAARAYVDHGDASELREDQLMRLDKDELDQIAREEAIEGRSKFNKEELAKSIREHFHRRNQEPTKAELYDKAKELDVDGRSRMDKDELKQAVREQD
jgi:hypothetical protein